MNIKSSLLLALCIGLVGLAAGCKKKEPEPAPAAAAPEFQWQIDQFADLRILRYQVPGFETLDPGPEGARLLPQRSRPLRPGHHLRPELQAQPHGPPDPRRHRPGLQGRPDRPSLGRVHDLCQARLVLQRHPPPLFQRQVRPRVRRGLLRRPGQGDGGRGLPPRRGPVGRRPRRLPEAHPLRSRRGPEEGLPGLDQGPGHEFRRQLL